VRGPKAKAARFIHRMRLRGFCCEPGRPEEEGFFPEAPRRLRVAPAVLHLIFGSDLGGLVEIADFSRLSYLLSV